MQVTYAHVKAFAHGTRLAQLVEMRDLYMSRSARRGATVINGGTAGRSSKGVAMPGIRIGSRKSDWHGVIYARKGFAPGFEGRFADEGVFQRTLAALDFWDNGQEPDRAAWNHFLKSCARETATCFETDAMQRGFQIEEFVQTFGGYARTTGEQMSLPMECMSPFTVANATRRAAAPPPSGRCFLATATAAFIASAAIII